MLYGFICRTCDKRIEAVSPDRKHVCHNVLMARDYTTVQLRNSAFMPHFNYATGQFVNTDREFQDALKRGAEENSLRTGMDHSYTPVYPGDVPRPTKDDYIFETQQRAHRDKKAPTETVEMS